ncbi:hypothetical protein CgunFtcFv8_000708 [Champsocephalus gunnari]|uniref:Uncharacterized protein n=1 Tax=Champsocephalus gunnari TaxID=52237 RepID=A0AAN8HTN6_CHAGU|nr:hypothetical protein CgunFtcFv8_000708 [Champsocephalus gunnari]
MADDRRSFQIEKEEMSMMRKAYIQDKTGIQRTRDAMQVKKENITHERKAFKKELEEKCRRRKAFTAEKDAMSELRRAFEEEREEMEKTKNAYIQKKADDKKASTRSPVNMSDQFFFCFISVWACKNEQGDCTCSQKDARSNQLIYSEGHSNVVLVTVYAFISDCMCILKIKFCSVFSAMEMKKI